MYIRYILYAVYIYMLKIIYSINSFPKQHVNDFALYTEAIKFFNHSESMVRITVRTITLNVYKGIC